MKNYSRRVFQNLWISILIFVLFVWFQILYTKNVPQCALSPEEFALMRSSIVDTTDCAEALTRWGLLQRAVTAFQRGEFEYSPMKMSLEITCRAAADVEFLEDNHECASAFGIEPLDRELGIAIKLWNSILPVFFECFYDKNDEACSIIIPTFSRFYHGTWSPSVVSLYMAIKLIPLVVFISDWHGEIAHTQSTATRN